MPKLYYQDEFSSKYGATWVLLSKFSGGEYRAFYIERLYTGEDNDEDGFYLSNNAESNRLMVFGRWLDGPGEVIDLFDYFIKHIHVEPKYINSQERAHFMRVMPYRQWKRGFSYRNLTGVEGIENKALMQPQEYPNIVSCIEDIKSRKAFKRAFSPHMAIGYMKHVDKWIVLYYKELLIGIVDVLEDTYKVVLPEVTAIYKEEVEQYIKCEVK